LFGGSAAKSLFGAAPSKDSEVQAKKEDSKEQKPVSSLLVGANAPQPFGAAAPIKPVAPSTEAKPVSVFGAGAPVPAAAGSSVFGQTKPQDNSVPSN